VRGSMLRWDHTSSSKPRWQSPASAPQEVTTDLSVSTRRAAAARCTVPGWD